MKVRSLLAAGALVTALSSVPITPASAVGVLASGSINVSGDFSSCARINFDTPQTLIVGEFSAIGYSTIPVQQSMSGPGGTVLDARPIVIDNLSTWSACLSGAGSAVFSGSAIFTLQASGPTGDILIIRKCVVVSGNMTCAGV